MYNDIRGKGPYLHDHLSRSTCKNGRGSNVVIKHLKKRLRMAEADGVTDAADDALDWQNQQV